MRVQAAEPRRAVGGFALENDRIGIASIAAFAIGMLVLPGTAHRPFALVRVDAIAEKGRIYAKGATQSRQRLGLPQSSTALG